MKREGLPTDQQELVGEYVTAWLRYVLTGEAIVGNHILDLIPKMSRDALVVAAGIKWERLAIVRLSVGEE